MSTAETPPAVDTIFVRSFDAQLAAGGDGRTLEARIVPYNTPALVADPPEYRPYHELFAPGAFEGQVRAFNRVQVWLNFEHQQGIAGVIGHGIQLDDRSDALYGSFRMHTGSDGDKALMLIREGLLKGLSMEFKSKSARAIDGVVHRVRAHLDRVSLCRFPAYEDAQVLALREQPELPDGQEKPPPPPAPPPPPVRTPLADDEQLQERLRALREPLEPVLVRATTSRPWDGSPARFTDEEYARSALFCRAGDASPKQRCSLPVLEPNGDVNTNALAAAAAALAGARGGVANTTREQKATAARKLRRYYSQAGMQAPPSLVALAGSA